MKKNKNKIVKPEDEIRFNQIENCKQMKTIMSKACDTYEIRSPH